jgi:hypothetical protein
MWIIAAALGIDDIEEGGDDDGDIDEVALAAPTFDWSVPHDVITPSARSPAPAAAAVRASLSAFFILLWCCE